MKLRRPWTDSDDELLRELAAKISPQRICVRLNRTLHAITNRADYLGIRFEHRHVLRKKPEDRSCNTSQST